jgi:hypothetical protein
MVSLTAGKRVLFLTKDPELIRRQLRGELDLQMKDLRVEELLDDINTDAMTPATAPRRSRATRMPASRSAASGCSRRTRSATATSK